MVIKISYNWLQEHIEEKLPSPQVVADAILLHAFEVEGVTTVGSDTVFDINVLPDRAGDALSHAGMAREVAGLLKLTLKKKESAPLPEAATKVPLDVQSDICRSYRAVWIEGVSVGPSPAWLRERLEAIGQKSINNVVDATNYVLFDSGQPVHAFDAAKIDGGIVVRTAHESETIKLLGGEEKNLKETDLVIADYLGAVALAGVKGGSTAEVAVETKSIIVEVANFDARAVRKTSRRLGLITDASKRFENNLSPSFVPGACGDVVALITSLAGGAVSAIAAHGIEEHPSRTIRFSVQDVRRLLGGSIGAADIEDVLFRYGYEYAHDGDAGTRSYTLTVPHYRADLVGTHDIAEEVGRVVGYDKIPPAPLPFAATINTNEIIQQEAALRAWAVSEGYREVRTYTFRSKGEVNVAYGAKGKDALCSNLSDGLKESFELNRLNAPLLGIRETKLFEIGTVFLSDREEIRIALCDKGTMQELPLADMLKEKKVDLTALPPLSAPLTQSPTAFVPWSPYPFIVRDIAVWIEGSDRTRLTHLLDQFAKKHGVPWQFFDEFSKDGRTSLAFRFIFQAYDRTMTDIEVATLWEELISTLKAENAFEIR